MDNAAGGHCLAPGENNLPGIKDYLIWIKNFAKNARLLARPFQDLLHAVQHHFPVLL